MQRKRGELVPIGDALADLGGPVKAIRDASPQSRHHFTQADQVNQLISASEADPALGFMARLMTLCSLPRPLRLSWPHLYRVSGRLVRFCTLSGAFLTSVEGDRVPVSDGS